MNLNGFNECNFLVSMGIKAVVRLVVISLFMFS